MTRQEFRRRRWCAVAVMFALTGFTAGCAPSGGLGSPTGAGSDPGPSGSPTPTATTPGPHPAGAACTSTDLVLANVLSDGAMGSVGTTFTVRNTGPVSCRLNGVPILHYGSGQLLPIEKVGNEQPAPPVMLAPGGTADLTVVFPNAYAGYGPDDPHCQHPVTYGQLTAQLDDGTTIGLGSAQIVIDCGGGIREGAWGPHVPIPS